MKFYERKKTFYQTSAILSLLWTFSEITDSIMSNILTPIKILLDMNVRTKSTYRAALEGLDMAMVKTLDDIKYDPYTNNLATALYKHPTNIRYEAAKQRLVAFETNKEVGLCDFVKYARNIIYDFLQVVKLGHIHSLHMDDSGMFKIDISCLLHKSGLDSNTSTDVQFADQLKHLENLGLVAEKSEKTGPHQFKDTDTHREVIQKILGNRGARLIRITSRKDMIERVSFILAPTDLCKFIENPADYSLPKGEELNDDEMIKMRKLVDEVPCSLAFINQSPDMLQTCGSVAESCFSEIEEIVSYEGEILRRVRERYTKEKAANMSIQEIEKEIGSKFPAEIARGVMEKVDATMAYFCVENLHATINNLILDEWGTVRVNIKISPYSDDLRYYHYFDDTKYNEPPIPDEQLVEDVFHVGKNRNGGIRLIDNENNRNTIATFVKSILGFEIDSIAIVRDDCNVTRTSHGEDDVRMENVFVIEQIAVSVDNIDGILRQYDLCKKLRKDA